MGKGENAGNQHFLLFLQCFQKPFARPYKPGLVWERVKYINNCKYDGINVKKTVLLMHHISHSVDGTINYVQQSCKVFVLCRSITIDFKTLEVLGARPCSAATSHSNSYITDVTKYMHYANPE